LKVIFKKGDVQMAENCRPIAILPILYKLFSKVLLARVSVGLDAEQSCDQAGFRSGFSCDDHLFAITLLAEKTNEFTQPLWMAAVDFKKAVDTIDHKSIWKALLDQGVNPTYVKCLQKMYTGQTGQVQCDFNSRSFPIERGTKQGDPISPTLFNAALEEALRRTKEKWHKKRWGFKVGGRGHGWVTNLRFADDVLLVGRSLRQVTDMLSDLVYEAGKVGLEIHMGKTKILNNGLGNSQQIKEVHVHGRSVEVLRRESTTMYLGRALNLCQPHDPELGHRISSGWAKFAKFKKELTDKDYSLYQRLRLFHSVVTPSVLYGSATWTMTASREQTLRVAQRRMLRMIIGSGRKKRCITADVELDDSSKSSKSDASYEETFEEDVAVESFVEWIRRVTAEAESIVKKLNLADWVLEQRRRKFRWAGHVARRDDGRWSTTILDWTPQGCRNRGRPKARWEDDLTSFAKCFFDDGWAKDWRSLSKDRATWKLLEEDFAHRTR
jgi:hypothetical protein